MDFRITITIQLENETTHDSVIGGKQPCRGGGEVFVIVYDFMMLAVAYGSWRCLQFIHDFYIAKSGERSFRSKLLGEDGTNPLNVDGAHPVHLACYLGDYQTLRVLHKVYKADFTSLMRNKLTCYHCAALDGQGVVSVFFLRGNVP